MHVDTFTLQPKPDHHEMGRAANDSGDLSTGCLPQTMPASRCLRLQPLGLVSVSGNCENRRLESRVHSQHELHFSNHPKRCYKVSRVEAEHPMVTLGKT